MKKRRRIKENATNEFSRLSGIETFDIIKNDGKIEHFITKKLTHSRMPIQGYAYRLYTDTEYNPSIKIESSCGLLNCVYKDHLIASYSPTRVDKAYILSNASLYSLSELADILKAPADLLSIYLNNIK